MKLNGIYKYFKLVQLIKAMFIPLILFTQPDYKSSEIGSVMFQFAAWPVGTVQPQQMPVQGGLNNFRVNGLTTFTSQASQ